jgi:hypothetical protein
MIDPILKQLKIYTVDNIPAWKVGEWEGQISSKWRSSKRILEPIKKKESNNFLY